MSAPTDPLDPRSWLEGFESGHAVGSMDAYRQGHIDGWGTGYRQGLAYGEWATRTEQEAWFDKANKGLASFLAKVPPYIDLAELRGEHERAEKQRQILRERGIGERGAA